MSEREVKAELCRLLALPQTNAVAKAVRKLRKELTRLVERDHPCVDRRRVRS